MGEVQFGLQDQIGLPVTSTRYSEQSLVGIPPRSSKFTIKEWNLSNNQHERNTRDQQQLADLVLAESERVIYEAGERSNMLKDTVDRRLEERIGDVGYIKKELEIIRKEIVTELEALGVYKTRIQDNLNFLSQNALNVSRRCLMMRDGRLGIDLVIDSVEEALQREIETIIGGQSLLKRALEQLQEQMRRLRATKYMLDRDLQYKQSAIDKDTEALQLKHTSLCLSIYEGYANLDPAAISAEEYREFSANNIKNAAKEVTSARPIRMYIDTMIKQVKEDLWTACKICNHEFNQRINETRNAKEKLEDMHKETSEKIVAMQNTITKLQVALADKEGHIGLTHTRLGKRAQRIGSELVKDPTGQVLYYETELLRKSVNQLQQSLFEANSTLRYLLQTQIQLEEDINIKMNTLKIDEVDCMTLRVSMDYHAY